MNFKINNTGGQYILSSNQKFKHSSRIVFPFTSLVVVVLIAAFGLSAVSVLLIILSIALSAYLHVYRPYQESKLINEIIIEMQLVDSEYYYKTAKTLFPSRKRVTR